MANRTFVITCLKLLIFTSVFRLQASNESIFSYTYFLWFFSFGLLLHEQFLLRKNTLPLCNIQRIIIIVLFSGNGRLHGPLLGTERHHSGHKGIWVSTYIITHTSLQNFPYLYKSLSLFWFFSLTRYGPKFQRQLPKQWFQHPGPIMVLFFQLRSGSSIQAQQWSYFASSVVVPASRPSDGSSSLMIPQPYLNNSPFIPAQYWFQNSASILAPAFHLSTCSRPQTQHPPFPVS